MKPTKGKLWLRHWIPDWSLRLELYCSLYLIYLVQLSCILCSLVGGNYEPLLPYKWQQWKSLHVFINILKYFELEKQFKSEKDQVRLLCLHSISFKFFIVLFYEKMTNMMTKKRNPRAMTVQSSSSCCVREGWCFGCFNFRSSFCLGLDLLLAAELSSECRWRYPW